MSLAERNPWGRHHMSREAVHSADWYEFQPGERVMTVEGLPGVVEAVEDGPHAGNEGYRVLLDAGLGGGSYSSSELRRVGEPGHRMGDPGIEVLAAGPGLNLWDMRNENQRKFPNKNWDEDGYCTMCARSLGENPEMVEVSIDGMIIPEGDPRSDGPESQGWWQVGSECIKRARNGSLAAFYDQGHVAVSDRFLVSNEADLHVASDDYPELGDILTERPPHVHAIPVRSRFSKLSVLDDGLANDIEKEADLWDMINNHVPEDLRVNEMQLNPAGAYWCRFRKHNDSGSGDCYFPHQLDAAGTAEAGYSVWVPQRRGQCPYFSAKRQKADCPVSEPGPHSGEAVWFIDATEPWSEGGQRDGGTEEDSYRRPGSATGQPGGGGNMPKFVRELALDNSWPAQDESFRFYVTAMWVDVRDKAKRIRDKGGVNIIAAQPSGSMYITAYVTGDHGLYETRIMRSPGRKTVAMWECGCNWAKYSWGRSGRWKRYEGRMCAHALALVYEAQAEQMFGGAISEKGGTPKWKQTDVQAPYGAWGHAAALHVEEPDYPPIVDIARELLTSGQSKVFVANLIASVESDPKQVGTLLRLATASPFPVKINDEPAVVVDIQSDGLVILEDGDVVQPADVVYPTWDPTIGLDAVEGAAKKPSLRYSPETHKVVRIRADEIQPGDRYIERKNNTHAIVDAVERKKRTTSGGATVSEVHVKVVGYPPMAVAPHSKHDVLRKREASLHVVAEADSEDGVMVALAIPHEVGTKYQIDGGEPVEEMHITLAYLGKDSEVDRAQAEAAVAEWCATLQPMLATSQGWGTFFNGEQNVLLVLWDVPGLAAARTGLITFLKSKSLPVHEEHDFTAHMTVLYTEDNIAELPEWPGAEEVPFGEVILSKGPEWKQFPFGGDIEKAAGGLHSEVHEPRARVGAYFDSGAGKNPDPTKPTHAQITIHGFETKEHAAEFAQRFPKSLNLRPTSLSTTDDDGNRVERGTVNGSVILNSNDANKGVNETGLKRFQGWMKALEKHGIPHEWQTGGAMNGYQSREHFEQHVGGSTTASLAADTPIDPTLFVLQDNLTGQFMPGTLSWEEANLRAAEGAYTVRRLDEVMEETDGRYTAAHVEATYHEEPEGALPTTDGDVIDDDLAAMELLIPAPGTYRPEADNDRERKRDDKDIAAVARLVAAGEEVSIAVEAVKTFTPREQQELINEGIDAEAGNLHRLDLEGTQYQALEAALAEADDDEHWLDT